MLHLTLRPLGAGYKGVGLVHLSNARVHVRTLNKFFASLSVDRLLVLLPHTFLEPCLVLFVFDEVHHIQLSHVSVSASWGELLALALVAAYVVEVGADELGTEVGVVFVPLGVVAGSLQLRVASNIVLLHGCV